MSFASMNDVEDYLMTPAYAQIQAEESKFVNEQKSEYFTCVNYNIINRLLSWRHAAEAREVTDPVVRRHCHRV